MKCPKCREPMEIVVFEGVEVDRCTGCKGIWFDNREAETLKAMKGSEAIDIGDPKVGRSFNERGAVPCPRCTTPMVRMVDVDQPHIWYERCSVCNGVYFDAGEFRDYKEHTLGDVFRRWFARARD